MKIKILVVGKTVGKLYSEAIADYMQRLSHYCPTSLTTIAALQNTRNMSHEEQCRREGELILRELQPTDVVVLLDEHGAEMTSREFATWIERRMMGRRNIVFVVGGPYGFDTAVRARAQELISLSRMTFSHQMVRLIFVEQLYRAFTIVRGESYHHD